MSERKAVIKNADMTDEMQQDAVEVCQHCSQVGHVLRCPFNYILARVISDVFVLLFASNVFWITGISFTSKQAATQAMEKFNIEKDIAAYVKKEFDKKYNPTWHCIVGRNFGSYVTHETKHFIYFYLGQVAVLLFKSG